MARTHGRGRTRQLAGSVCRLGGRANETKKEIRFRSLSFTRLRAGFYNKGSTYLHSRLPVCNKGNDSYAHNRTSRACCPVASDVLGGAVEFARLGPAQRTQVPTVSSKSSSNQAVVMGRRLKNVGGADMMPTSHSKWKHQVNPLSCPLSTFSVEGGFKVNH